MTWKEFIENMIEEGGRELFKEQVFPEIQNFVSEQAPGFIASIFGNFSL